MKLEDIDVSKLLPLFMRGDRDTAALAEVVSETLQPLAREVAKLSTWGHLEQLAEPELDSLAEELSVLWYDKSFTAAQKRLLILNSDRVYMRLGTVSAVQEVVSQIFGDSRVEEWHEYGGVPNYFRLNVTNVGSMSRENEAKLVAIIDAVKRKSQWLEKIINEIEASFEINIGGTVAISKHTYVKVWDWQDHVPATTLQAGATTVTRK